MTKRHKPAKKSHEKKKAKQRSNRPTRLPNKKGSKESVKKRRPSTAKKTPTKKPRSKVVAKVRSVFKRKVSSTSRRNKRVTKHVEKRRFNTPLTKRRKTIPKSLAKSALPIRKGKRAKVESTFTETKTLKTSKLPRHDKEGKRIKEKTIPGYRQYFRIDLLKGNFEQIIDTIRNGNFSFLNEGLNRNRPIKGKGSKEPRAVIITIETSYRGTKHYHRKISDIDFIVRKDNVKKLILDRLVEYQDNWLERAEENEDYLEASGKAFAPKNIDAVMIEFVY